MKFKEKFYQFLRWTEKYTGTDMVYFFEGSFWWILGRIFSFLASFLILFFFAKFATKEVFGAYQYILSLSAILGIFCLIGLDTALVRAIAKGKERTFFLCEKEKLKFSLLTFLGLALISLWYFLKKNFELSISFLIPAIFVPLISVFSLYLAFWYGKKRFDIQNKYFIYHNFLASILICLAILLKPKLIFVIFAYYFSFALATFIFYQKTKKEINKSSEEDRETISFGKHLTVMNLPWAISHQIDKVILWQFGGPVPVAVYTFALRLVERISELIPFSVLAFPKMAEKDLKANEVKKRIFDKFLKLFLLAIPFTLLYILICPIFFQIFFPAYNQSIIYSQVLALILIFSPFSFLATTFLAEVKKRELYILNFFPQILKIILFFLLIPLFGIWGGVSSILISQIFNSILTLYFFKNLNP